MKHISGTNPLLLSWIPNDVEATVNEYESIVLAQLRNFLANNCEGLTRYPSTPQGFFLLQQVLRSRVFADMANRGYTLNKMQTMEYSKTWLHCNWLTILEDSPSEEVLLEHELMEQDTIEQDAPQPMVTRKVLRWNFPCMGEIYINMLQDFVSSHSETQLQDTCTKVPSFAGFWYESLFFSHYKQSCYSIMMVDYSKQNRSEVLQLQFKIDKIQELSLQQNHLDTNALYEMRASYPIVDAVGHFQEITSGQNWLVFIQISLQEYERHRCLSDLFHRSPQN